MTITHLSHFGLTVIGQTADNMIFEGTLAACRRMAFAHGMEIDRYEGRTVSIEGRRATYTTASENDFSFCWLKQGGFINKTRDGYCLVMPMNVWINS
jgi:hypothetical protein